PTGTLKNDYISAAGEEDPSSDLSKEKHSPNKSIMNLPSSSHLQKTVVVIYTIMIANYCFE
ncbi:MAG: hypothetical protein WBO36_10675, partial [Saprospiraceae bacterium]